MIRNKTRVSKGLLCTRCTHAYWRLTASPSYAGQSTPARLPDAQSDSRGRRVTLGRRSAWSSGFCAARSTEHTQHIGRPSQQACPRQRHERQWPVHVATGGDQSSGSRLRKAFARKLEPAAQGGKGGGELGDVRGRERTKRRAKRPMRKFIDNSRNKISWIWHGAQTWGEQWEGRTWGRKWKVRRMRKGAGTETANSKPWYEIWDVWF